MDIRLTKSIEDANCITHAGTFHADEIFSTIILSKIIPEQLFYLRLWIILF